MSASALHFLHQIRQRSLVNGNAWILGEWPLDGFGLYCSRLTKVMGEGDGHSTDKDHSTDDDPGTDKDRGTDDDRGTGQNSEQGVDGEYRN